MTIRRATRRRELELADHRLVWAGPTDPEPEAPLVECELPVPFDPAAMAIPSTLLRELAIRFPAIESPDPRWRRARDAADRRPTERGVTSVGPAVVNPRDDWAMPGIEVDRDFLALDGRYSASTGVVSTVAIQVGAGMIATFARCDLRTGRDGEIATRDATILLIDCALPAIEWTLGANCHLVILGGTIPSELRIHLAPSATLTVEGLIERRVSRLSLLSNAPHGIPFVVEGEAYAWSRDDASGNWPYVDANKVPRYTERYIHITHATKPTVSFVLPDRRATLPRWWRRSDVTDQTLARAVQIAARTGHTLLDPEETEEAFAGHGATLEDELIAARAALDGLLRPPPDSTREAFVDSMVAIGCADRTPEARTAIDDWVASHAMRCAPRARACRS